jgi:flagellar biosynthesis protein FlgN
VTESTSAIELLTHQINQLNELEQLLKNEYEVLQQHNPDKLVAINKLKNSLLIDIESTDKLLANHSQFLADKKSGQYTKEIETIENTLIECKNLNLVNGEIIQKSQVSIERMKTTLLENHTKSTLTYDNKGKTSGGLSSLDLKA